MESSALSFWNSWRSVSLAAFSCSTSACFLVMFERIVADIRDEFEGSQIILSVLFLGQAVSKRLSSKRGAQLLFMYLEDIK